MVQGLVLFPHSMKVLDLIPGQEVSVWNVLPVCARVFSGVSSSLPQSKNMQNWALG